jgi:hypothetical protein
MQGERKREMGRINWLCVSSLGMLDEKEGKEGRERERECECKRKMER